MNDINGQKLYELLPAVHRVRDSDRGEPLRALMGIIQHEAAQLENNIDQLFDDCFIETCAEWVVPYIGDLLGVRGLVSARDSAYSQRALVANTLAYRKGKGTAAVLEQLARDATGYPAKVVEFFKLLSTSQYLNHVRLGNRVTLDLHDSNRLELIHSPFEQAAHTAEVRHIDVGRGKCNIPNIGIFLWRLQSYFLINTAAREAGNTPDGRYTFNPLGTSLPLFNRPRTEAAITQLAAEENVPGALRRRPMYDELEARRQALVDDRTPLSVYFGPQPVLEVYYQESEGGDYIEVAADEMLICNLSDPMPAALLQADWRRPPATKRYYKSADGTAVDRPIKVAVDPVEGRLAFPTGVVPHRVNVSYAYGFSGDLGGGPYNRRASIRRWLDELDIVTWQRGVTRNPEALATAPEPDQLYNTLDEAINAWRDYLNETEDSNPFGIIAIMDSASYLPANTSFTQINLPVNSRLAIVAADWPAVELSDQSGRIQREVGRIIAEDRRPHIQGNLTVAGGPGDDKATPGQLVLDGLLIEGSLTVAAGNLGGLRINHCTLVPELGGVTVEAGNVRLGIDVHRSISGPVTIMPDTTVKLSVVHSIIDGVNSAAIQAPDADVDLQGCSVLGTLTSSRLEAGNCIITGRVHVVRRQLGCVRFSYLPVDSLSSRRYRCQPSDAALADIIVPQFTSIVYGQPGYGQLAPACPVEIITGAEDEGEMGAFHFLQQTHRIKNLRANLTEYLRFGLEAGIFLVQYRNPGPPDQVRVQ